MEAIGDFYIIPFPEVEDFQELEGFEEHSALIEPNDNIGIEPGTYLVEKEWVINQD